MVRASTTLRSSPERIRSTARATAAAYSSGSGSGRSWISSNASCGSVRPVHRSRSPACGVSPRGATSTCQVSPASRRIVARRGRTASAGSRSSNGIDATAAGAGAPGSASIEASASRTERDRRRMRSGPASAATRSTSPLVASPSPERSRKKPPSRYPASRSNAGPSRVARAVRPVTSSASTVAREDHRRVPTSICATPPPSAVRSTRSNPASPSISRSRSGSGR